MLFHGDNKVVLAHLLANGFFRGKVNPIPSTASSSSTSLPAPNGKTTVAVKLIDMLGEEVLTVRDA